MKCWARSVAKLDGKVYIAVQGGNTHYVNPLMYDSYKDKWFTLPALPHVRFSLVVVCCKHLLVTRGLSSLFFTWEKEVCHKQLLAIGGVSGGKVSGQVFAWEEDDQEWTTPYPNLPTARFGSCSASHGSAVIVAGGVTCCNPFSVTGVVEVLYIDKHAESCWTEVERLPHVVYDVVPVIIDDDLYICAGFDKDGSTCDIVSASLPELLQSGVRSGRVWNKLPDMPYSSLSINQYQGRLIIFTGDRRVEQPGQGKSTWELISQIHLYNRGTKSWDHVGDVPCNYLLGISVHISENEILFISGLTGTHTVGKCADMLVGCLALKLEQK